MRDFLQDAISHRDAGYGRAQKPAERDLPRRFYTDVAVAEQDGGLTVTLDGRAVKTPTRKPVVVGSAALAEHMKKEWAGQGELVDPETMPHVKLVNSAIEGGEAARPEMLAEVVRFCGSDLLLYRADTPRELVARQEEVWDAVLVGLARHFSIRFEPTVGIVHKAQSPETLARLERALAPADFMTATALISVTGIMGSGLLAIALREKLIDRDTAWTAAHVDEDYQISLWGEDYEASARRVRRRGEFDAAINVMEWLAG